MDFLNQQFKQQQNDPRRRTWWEQTQTARRWFLSGLVMGLLLGWFFHGVVSLILRLGFFVLLLVPLLVIGWLFLRSRRGPEPEERQGPRVYTFGNLPFDRGPFGGRTDAPPPRREREEEPVIEINDEDYDLERFKRKLEQER